MTTTQTFTQTETDRFHYLDSARGIAAMSVLIGHFSESRLRGNFYFNLGSTVINAADAVSFFFVLSGFVLSFKYLHSNKVLDVKQFYYKRILRLYPAYIFTVLICFLSGNQRGIVFAIFRELFYENKQSLWQELFMIRGVHNWYGPGWTLDIEMIFSLLLPIFIICAQKNIKAIIWIVPLYYLIGAGYIAGWVVHFCLGIIAAYYYPEIKSYDFSKSKLYPYRWLIFLATYFAYSMRQFDHIWNFNQNETFRNFGIITRTDFFHYSGFASFVIIVWIINSTKAQRFLNVKPLLFLGKISYGIYLMHWLPLMITINYSKILMAFFKEEYYYVPVMLLVQILVTVILATCVYYYIEKPFMNLANRKTAS